MLYRFLYLILIFSSYTFTYGQQLTIGEWKSYLPYRNGRLVTQSADKAFYATDFAIVILDKEDKSHQFLSKTEGLSNTGIQQIQYNPYSDILIVVYSNSVIDLVHQDGTIKTLNQLKNFKNIIGAKTINDIHVANDSIVYLAASYGISKLNLLSEEFVFTTFTNNIPTYDIEIYQNQLVTATEEGIFSMDLNTSIPEDFGQWQFWDSRYGLPDAYFSKNIILFKDKLYFDINDEVYQWSDNTLNPTYELEGHQVQYLSANANYLLIGLYCVEECDGTTKIWDGNQLSDGPTYCVNRPVNAVIDESNRVWFADNWDNFRFTENINNDCGQLLFNAPYSHRVNDIAISEDGTVWIAAGGVTAQFGYLFRSDGFFKFQDGQWDVFNLFNQTALTELFDFLSIVIHPANQKIYTGSFLDGLVEYDKESFTIYNDQNSSLNNAVGDEQRTRVSSLAFDTDNNLWIANHAAERPISVFTNDGNWQNFKPNGCNERLIEEISVDAFGYKWLVLGNGGVMVFDSGEDLTSTQDDRCRIFNTSNSELPSNSVNTITTDLSGEVWIGTANGIAVLDCGSNVFESACVPRRRTTDQDETNLGYLLDGNEVTTIAIDGANRKWLGTNNGIFVQSADGSEQVAHFTTVNSPLLDNVITDIAIDPTTGNIWIGTEQGLIVYKGEATNGGRINSVNAYAYPNPVYPDYEGVIAIKGLAENADVKITNIAGALVYETQALGGQAIWDGTDYNGQAAAPGVYLVFSTSNNLTAPDALATKILIIR